MSNTIRLYEQLHKFRIKNYCFKVEIFLNKNSKLLLLFFNSNLYSEVSGFTFLLKNPPYDAIQRVYVRAVVSIGQRNRLQAKNIFRS
jgi:hypothetical protein